MNLNGKNAEKRKITPLSMKEKKELILLFENANIPKSTFAKQYGIARSTLTDILSSKESIENSDCKEWRKRIRNSKFKEVEEVLMRWLKFVRSENRLISTAILKEKALEIAKELKVENFNASSGWIERFKVRHNICFKKLCEEAISNNVVENWRNNVLQDVLTRYSEPDIFSLDEIGLFYRLLPHEVVTFKDETCSDGKHSELRLTVLFGANMGGTEKLKPLVIGNRKSPKCFENIKSLPVDYYSNSNAWMSPSIWEECIRKLDGEFLLQGRKVAFVLNTCPVHFHLGNLDAIELIFIPPKISTILQPLNQGVIFEFKRVYKTLLANDLIKSINENRKFDVSIFDAICYIHKSWSLVSNATLKNCFKLAGFVSGTEQSDIGGVDSYVLSLWSLLEIANKLECTVADLIDYINIDNNVAIGPPETLEVFAAEFLEVRNELEDEEVDNDGVSVYTPPSKVQVVDALETIRRYLTSIEHTTDEEFNALTVLEKTLHS
ncbi:tigger transposable element-derived protein 4-like [Uloborus diversus]|uniref:tigger transposable element-derived protein 4-like n=1 Tax=Uloborus diversus TaxID=327109 RepID=UPI00240959AE|nr:tigger transposable element-derived protein 4-like [Uloborus diversus]